MDYKPTRLLCPWNSLGKNTRGGSHSLLQGIFLTQGSNPVSWITSRFFIVWATREARHLFKYQRSFYEYIKCSDNELFGSTGYFQFSSVTQSCLTLCDPMDCSTPGLLVHHQLPELIQTHVHWVGDGIQPSHPLSFLLLPPSIFPSIRVFSHESALHIRWPKCWSFSFNISPSNEHPGLISFRMDWLDLLAVQGTRKSLLQHHSSKASILRRSNFFKVQLTSIYDYWKNHSLD